MDDCVSITLLRHGMTIENEQKKYLGWKDARLSDKGIEQLTLLKTDRYPKPDLLFTSDLLRCTETARILYPEQEISPNSLFREYHFGEWDTKTYEQLKDDKRYQNWLNEPMKITPPNGESFKQFQERIMAGWQLLLDELANDKVKNIVLVAHGGVLRLLLHYFANEQKNFWEWSTPFGGGYTLVGQLEKFRRGERCTSLQAVPSMEN